ncbi:MAG TPA: carboxypeptidase regulatory-like domain-containing protein [Bryobacteraceae bacterium]|jgi:hypothetical protein|nr:carboxypeptidase regulatory-like domain-containing protein [Bryobacteraceae bacterium]
MQRGKLLLLSLLGIASALAQGNRGSITGTVTDPVGAVVAGVAVEGKNIDSGGLYKTASTSTGNYTLSELPPGNYEVTFAAPGFKTFKRGPLDVGARQILRIDGALEVGTAAESITVTEAAPLLITESSEVGYNVNTNRLNDLPVGNMGSVRNIVRTAAVLMPGVSFSEGFFGGVKINGTPTDGYNLRIDGMDNTYTLGNLLVTQVQPSVDAIEQYSIQTSNFAAELGQAGGAIFNVNMKSGTNQFHGSAFDYYSTDTLYAAQPYTKLKSPTSNYDWGFTIGGPVAIPKLYNGHDKTFFFFSYETRPQEGTVLTTFNTVPTDAYRLGDLSAALAVGPGGGTKQLGTDVAGRPILQDQVYDPASNFTNAAGQVLRNPFVNNQIQPAQFDPVSAKLLTLVPKANLAGLIQNYNNPYLTASKQYLPSFKIDHNINASNKLNFFFSRTTQRSPIDTGEGFPTLISAGTNSDWINKNYRLNYDRTITPTMLLHLGVGYQDATIGQLAFAANTPYDATAELGLKGPFFHGEGSTFPHFGSNNLAPGTGMSNAQGGLSDLGNASFNGTTLTKNQRPTAIASLTWVKDNHTYKFGGELRVDGFPAYNLVNLNGYFAFSANETALPYLNSATLAGNTLGFPFASFLLGQVDQGNTSSPANAKLGTHSLGFFAQDTWKVSRKLTLDYGLRWDYSTYQKEQYGRYPTLDPRAPNASAGGHPGAVTYEATCGCRFAPNYPYAWGPRLGAAYQIDRKTVVRGGIGLMYNTSARIGIAGRSLGSNNPFTSPSFGEPAMVLGTGVQATYQQIAWPNFNPNYYPVFGRSPGAGPANVFDQNAARPARQLQWSIGLQREIFRDLVVEASYVGNVGVWWTAGAAVSYNTLQPSTLQALKIDINNPADVTLLNSQIGSAAVKDRGFGLPFSGFPSNATLAQALRPYPQFSSGLTPQFAPLGTTSYNSLQAKVTKRLSHGIDFTYAFTYQKSLVFGTSINDVWNRAANNQVLDPADQPLQSVIAFTYNVPRMHGVNKFLAYALYDWQVGGILKYASGFPIPVPGAQNNLGTVLFQNTYANRVPGQPLFLKDLNSHLDPRSDFVLNPLAWTDPAAGQWGVSAPFYSDYRYQRRPSEAMNFGRNFQVGERLTFQARVEFTNVLNRAQAANPTVTNAKATQVRGSGASPNTGFGAINYTVTGQAPRQGQMVLRMTF